VYVRLAIAAGSLTEGELSTLMSYLSQNAVIASKMTSALQRTNPVFSTVVVSVSEPAQLHDDVLVATTQSSSSSTLVEVDPSKWSAKEFVAIAILLALVALIVAVVVNRRRQAAYRKAVAELTPTGKPIKPRKRKKSTTLESIELTNIVALAGSTDSTTDIFVAGHSEENADMNRRVDVLPYDRNRVVVGTTKSFVDGYMNASLIGSIGMPLSDCFIAVQTPKASSAAVFWQMVWEYSSSFVVAISEPHEFEQSVSFVMPPEPGVSVIHGDFVVVGRATSQSVDTRGIKHDILLMDGEGHARSITLFEYRHWPDDGVPEKITDLVELCVAAELGQLHANGPMVVYSAAASGRAGTFIGAVQQVRMFTRQREIDPFKGAVALRKVRPGMVASASQYVFMHKVVVKAILRNMALFSREGLSDAACDVLEKLTPTKSFDLSVPGRHFVKVGRLQRLHREHGRTASADVVLALMNDVLAIVRVTLEGTYELIESPIDRRRLTVTVPFDSDWDECLMKIGGKALSDEHVIECGSPAELQHWIAALEEKPTPRQGKRRLMAPTAPTQKTLLGTLGIHSPFSGSGVRELELQHASLPWAFDNADAPHAGDFNRSAATAAIAAAPSAEPPRVNSVTETDFGGAALIAHGSGETQF
jgi:protein tyrosine phosphatase